MHAVATIAAISGLLLPLISAAPLESRDTCPQYSFLWTGYNVCCVYDTNPNHCCKLPGNDPYFDRLVSCDSEWFSTADKITQYAWCQREPCMAYCLENNVPYIHGVRSCK